MYRLLILVGFVATSCAPAYISNSRNVPMFAEGGEFAGSVALSSGIDVQAAYSLTNHVAIMANANTVFKKYTPEGKPSFTKDHFFGEAGVGYFTRTKAARFEVYGGYGIGEGNSYESYFFFGPTELVAKGKYSRIFFQPSIGTNKKKFNLIFTTRVSMVNFSEFSTEDPAASVAPYKPVYKPNKAYAFIEPSLTARAHLAGNLRGFVQLGLNQPVDANVFFGFVRLQAAIGIQIHTGQLRTRVY